MSAKAIREATGKDLINRNLCTSALAKCRFASVSENTNWRDLVDENPWLKTQPLVVKPDQLIKRRGKLGLIKVNTNLAGAEQWIKERMNKDQEVGKAKGKLRNFIIEPFIAHKPAEEAYVCIYSHRKADTILFHHEGGVDIGDVDAKALKLDVPIGGTVTVEEVKAKLLGKIPAAKQSMVATFISSLYKMYADLYFTYLEVNPLVVTDDSIYSLDLDSSSSTAVGSDYFLFYIPNHYIIRWLSVIQTIVFSPLTIASYRGWFRFNRSQKNFG